jgi:hypothetical protein
MLLINYAATDWDESVTLLRLLGTSPANLKETPLEQSTDPGYVKLRKLGFIRLRGDAYAASCG